MEDVFDVPAFELELAQDFVDQGAVFDDEQVGVEDAGVLGADRFGDPLLHFEDLLAGEQQGGLEAGQFAGQFGFFDLPGGEFLVLGPDDAHGAACDAGRNAHTLEPTFTALLGFAH